MIIGTKMGGKTLAINNDLIERITANPDTTIQLVDGSVIIVTETVAEIVDKISASRAHTLALAYAELDRLQAKPVTEGA